MYKYKNAPLGILWKVSTKPSVQCESGHLVFSRMMDLLEEKIKMPGQEEALKRVYSKKWPHLDYLVHTYYRAIVRFSEVWVQIFICTLKN